MNTIHKQRHEAPPPESIGMNPWAFTINCGYDELHINLLERYVSVFKLLSKYCVIEMRPEFSKKMKLHYHGTIRLKSYACILPFYTLLMDLQKHYTYAMKPIIDYEWYLYCIKQRHIMKQWCRGVKKPYKITNTWFEKANIVRYFGHSLKSDLDY